VCPWLGLESGACVLVLEIISNCYCGRTGRRAGSDTIVIHHNGHGPCNGGEPARKTECTDCTPNFDTAQDWFNQLGYDSMEVFMPLHGCNRIRADQSCSAHCVSNAERGFDCSKCKPLGTTDSMVGSHQWFDQFEQMGDEAMRYFLEPVVLAVNCATIPRRSTAAGSLRCVHGSMVRVGAWLTVCFVLFCFVLFWVGGLVCRRRSARIQAHRHGRAVRRRMDNHNLRRHRPTHHALDAHRRLHAQGESKRLVVESPWSQFISTCQRH
jgi:hypothetical protein